MDFIALRELPPHHLISAYAVLVVWHCNSRILACATHFRLSKSHQHHQQMRNKGQRYSNVRQVKRGYRLSHPHLVLLQGRCKTNNVPMAIKGS